MSKAEFKYNKFDPTEEKIEEMAKLMAGNFGTGAPLRIEDELAQILRVRVSLLKVCDYCTVLHFRRAKALGIEEDKISAINSYKQSELFSEKEKVALSYTDSLVNHPNSDFEAAYNELTKHFTEEEVVDIASCVINMIFFVHYKLATGHTSFYE